MSPFPPHPHPPPPPHKALHCACAGRAFTLIEVLAVVAIAALVVTIATTSLHAVAASTQLLRTKAGLAQMDARGRMHARASGEAVMLELDVDGRGARLVGTRSSELLAEMDIPRAIGLIVELPRDVRSVVFDRRGVSVDYAIMLRDDVRAVESRMDVAGLTAEIIESEVAP